MADFQEFLAILDVEPTDAQALAALEQLASVGDGLSSPTAARALAEARRLHRDRGDLELCARLIDVELSAVSDSTRKADLLFEKGKLLSDDLLNDDGAVECFQRVLELRPDDENAQELLAQIDLIRTNWEKIVKKYVDEAKIQTDRQLTTSLYLSAAETYARYKPEAAEVEQYLRRALEIEPRNRRAATHVERLLRKAGRWEELAQFLQSRVDAAATKDERIQALLGLADIAKSRLGNTGFSYDCMKKVLALDPAHPRAIQSLIDVYSGEENWGALVKVYEGALKVRRTAPAGSPGAADGELAMYLQIAMLHWKRLSQLDAAEEYFRRIRKIDAAHPAMVEFYRAYHKDRGEGAKLLQVLQAAQKGEKDAERRGALGVEIAGLAEGAVGNPEKAIDSWKAILRGEPKNAEARAALRRLYEKTEKWNALLELLKEEIEAIPSNTDEGKRARVELLLDVVSIYLVRLNLDVMVINTYNAILALIPDHRGALEALAMKYEQLGRWNDLITVLWKKAEASWISLDDKKDVLRRIAMLWTDRFGNHAQAIKPLEELLTLDRADRDAAGRLKEIYAKRRQWRGLLDLLAREVDTLAPELRRSHLGEMARLASERLGDARASIAIWNRVLVDEPDDAEALAQLALLYEKEKRFLALAEIMHRQREVLAARDPHTAIAILEKLGNLYAEKLGAPRQGAECFQEILLLQPGHPKATRVLRELHAQAGDFDSLEKLYGTMGAWDELLEVLHGIADRSATPEDKLRVFARIANLATDKLRAPEKAARAHERILGLDPKNVDSARALVPIYRDSGKWARLLSTYEALLAHAEEPAAKLALLVDIRQLCEDKLGSKALAFQWCARAWEVAPAADRERLLAELMRLGADADAWEQVAEILTRRIRAEGVSTDDQLRLLREVGRIRAVRLHKLDDSRAAWDEVLTLAPDDNEALTALEELHTQQARWPDLLVVFGRRAALEKDAEKRVEMLFRIAFIQEERVADLDGAAKTYDQILELTPKSQRALRGLSKVNAARGDASGLARALELELAQADDGEARVQTMLRLGGLYEEKLGQRKKALEAYQACLALQPTNRAVHGALERFLAPAAEERVEVAKLMAPIYERAEDPSKLALTLEILRGAEKNDAERLVLDRRLTALYAKRLRDPLNAYEAATRVLGAAPDDADNRKELHALAAELQAFDDLATHLEKALTATATAGDEKAQREIARELAELYDERLSKPTEAEVAWRKVLDLESTDERAYDAIERLLRAQARWDDLRELLSRREENSLDAGRRLQIVLQICDLYEGVLDHAPGAIAAYKRALELDPSLLRAYKALERLYAAEQRWADLEDLLGQELSHVDQPAALLDLIFRRAALRAEHLDDASGAVDLAEEVLAKDGKHTGARGLLEALLPRAELRLRIARQLAPRYEADSRWAELVRMLRAELEFASGPEAVELQIRIAGLLEERLADEERAFAAWIEALGAAPEERRIRGALERLARRLDRWRPAAEAWEAAIERLPVTDLATRGTLLAEVATIYDRALGDVEKAIHAYRRLLDAETGDVEATRAAADALQRLYDEQEAWPELIEILRRQTEIGEPTKRVEHFQRIAAIQEHKLRDEASAIATWREVLLDDAENAKGLDALERLHTARTEWRDLVDVLRRRVEHAKDPTARRDLLSRIAGLHERELHDVSEAILAELEIIDFLPEDRQALAELSRLYRGAERWSDLLDVDERRLGLTTDPDERAVLTFVVGVLLRDRLERRAEALDHFRDLLSSAPSQGALAMGGVPGARAEALAGALAGIEGFLTDEDLKLRAAEILQPIYQSANQFGKLVDLYELEVAALDDVREQISRLRKIAELRERNLRDADAALDAYTRACRLALAEPDLRDLLAAVQRLAIDRDRVPDLIKLYRELAPDVLDADLQRSLYLDVADLTRGKLQDPVAAKDYYRRVLDSHPDDPRALSALEQLSRELKEWEPLREILLRRVERTEDLDEKREALVEVALLCEEKLVLGEEAVTAWEQVLEISPSDVDAAKSLERLYIGRERWVELAELLERRLGFAEEMDEAVDLRFRLGELYEKHLTDPDRAVENFEAALGGDPQHAPSVAALERYLDDAATRLSAAEILEPIYISRQAWPALIRITEIRLDAETDPANRRALTKRVARLYEEQLEDLEGAFRWTGRVFREDPDDRAIRDQLVRLAAILERWDGLANIYQEFLDDESGDTPAIREVARSLAEIYDRRLADVEHARLAYKRLLEATPDDTDAFTRLEAMLTRAARWFVLIESYETAIQASLDTERQKQLWTKIAQVQEQRLDAVEKAINAYRSILDLDADDAAAAGELDRLFRAQKRWTDLAELLTSRLERAADAAAGVPWRLALAEVLENKLLEVGSAIDQHEMVLAADPASVPALTSLERLVVNEEHRQRIAQLLEPVYRRQDWWQKLVVILDAQLEYVDDPSRRVEMLREIAKIHETRGGAMSLALRALARAWKEDVTSEDVYADLYRVAERMEAWQELVDTLDGGIEGIYDYDLAARLLGRIGTIEDEKRKDRTRAIGAWRRVLEVKDDDAAALDALERLYTLERQFDALVAVLEKKVELNLDAPLEEKKTLLYRIAEFDEKSLLRKDAAIATWRRVLELHDEDGPALDALERLLGEKRDHRALVDILQRKIELSLEPSVRRPLRLAAAQVYDTELGDVFEAIGQYKAILEDQPADGEALAALDVIYGREKSWSELVEILDRRIELAQEPAVRAELSARAAEIVEKEQGEAEPAIERYRQILEATPTHASTRAALERLTGDDDTLEPAAAALEPVYRREQAWDALARLLERRIGCERIDPDRRRADVASLAETHETGRRDLAAAHDTWARQLRQEPEDVPAQTELERIAGARGDWGVLAALYEQILGDTMDAELGRAYALKLATLFEEALGDLDRAASFYRKGLEHGGDESVPLSSLDRIYDRQGRWSELAEILAREAQAAMSDDEQATFLYRLGDVRERSLNNAQGAVEAYRDVLERVPNHEAARTALERLMGNPSQRAAVITILEPIFEADSDHRRLVDLLEAKVTIEDSSAERASQLARIAELSEKHLGDQVRALDAVGRWLAEDPTSEQAAHELERLAGELVRWEEAAARLTDVLSGGAATADREVARELSLRLGRILLEKLGDAANAEPAYRRVLELEPGHLVALGALERIYRVLSDIQNLSEILSKRGEAELDSVAKRAAFAETAKLREERLRDDQGAVTAWQQILELDENDREAHARLASIHERNRAWEPLLAVLDMSTRFVEDRTEEKRLKSRIAQILTTELAALDRAVDAWHALADLSPDDDAPLVQLTAVQAQRGDWLAVQEALVRRLSLASSGGAKITILAELARVAEVERSSSDEAIGYWHQILDVDNAHAPAYEALDRLLVATERHHDRVEVLLRQADVKGTLGDIDGERALLLAAADVWEGPLGNPDAAAEILEKVHQRAPRHVPTLTRLAKIYEVSGDLNRGAETLEKALALGPMGRDAADLHFRLGKIAEAKSEDLAEAVPHFQRALSFDGSHLDAITALERGARERGDWVEVAGLLSRREAAETDAAAKLPLALELAELYRVRLGRPADAIPYLERAERAKPDDVSVAESLAELYFSAGRAHDAEPIYRRLADAARAGRRLKDMARYEQRLGALREAAGDFGQALKSYEEAFRVDATHSATMAGLGRIYFAQQEWEKARRVYRSMLLQNLNPSVGVSKADVYLQLGLIHAKLNEGPKAKSMYERGLELEPTHSGLKAALAEVAK